MTGKKGMFGPAVIGEEAFAREKEEVAKGVDYFGPAVVGPSEPQKPTPTQLRDQPGLAVLHGLKPELPGVPTPGSETGRQSAAPPESPPTPATDNPQLSVAKIAEALEASPFVLDSLIEQEFKRAEGPRKDAIRLFIKYERKNLKHEAEGDVYARPEILQILEETLKKKPAAVSA